MSEGECWVMVVAIVCTCIAVCNIAAPRRQYARPEHDDDEYEGVSYFNEDNEPMMFTGIYESMGCSIKLTGTHLRIESGTLYIEDHDSGLLCGAFPAAQVYVTIEPVQEEK